MTKKHRRRRDDRPAAPDGGEGPAMTVAIPPGLVPLVRDGACVDMYEQYKEAEALMEQGNWPGPRAEVDACFARAQATWRLLEAMAVSEVERGPPPVEVDAVEHREVLRRIPRRLMEDEGATEANNWASGGEKAVAQARAAELADLIRCVEEAEAGAADHERGDRRTEALIAQNLIFAEHREGRTLDELEALLAGVDPEALGDALGGLQDAGVVILDGEQVRPSPCALRLDELRVIGL
jgi:hypothetical protein